VSAYDLGRFAERHVLFGTTLSRTRWCRDFCRRFRPPTLILAGDHDDLVPWSNNQYLADTMPNSVAHRLDAGHFAWEEAAGEYGRLVSEWIAGGYKNYAGS
jgi:pimeloyl-ACP methyl ester carboxylesterase